MSAALSRGHVAVAPSDPTRVPFARHVTTHRHVLYRHLNNPCTPFPLPGDISIGRGEEEKPPAPDTVQAKSPEEIQARIDAAKKHQ